MGEFVVSVTMDKHLLKRIVIIYGRPYISVRNISAAL